MRRKLGGSLRQWYWDHPGGAHPGNYLVLDQGLLAFYYHRRGLEDIADFLVCIANGDGNPQRDQEDLEELLEILDGLAQLDEVFDRGVIES